jgi:hypothetical protein
MLVQMQVELCSKGNAMADGLVKLETWKTTTCHAVMHALSELFSEAIDPQTSSACIRAGGMNIRLSQLAVTR